MIPGVILSAGESSRMGRAKALLRADASGITFVRRLALTLRDGGCEEVIVVVGHEAEAIASDVHASDFSVRVVFNARWREGQLSSLVAALELVHRPGVEAVAVALVDAPFVDASTVRRLLDVHRRERALIVRPEREGRHGHPVVFDRRVFDELRHADLRVGAKAVVRAHAQDTIDVPIEDNGAFDDIDTPEDYAKLGLGSV